MKLWKRKYEGKKCESVLWERTSWWGWRSATARNAIPGKKKLWLHLLTHHMFNYRETFFPRYEVKILDWWFWSSWFRNSDLHINVLWSCAFVQLVQAVTLKWKFYATSPVNTNSSVGENGFLVKNGPCVPWWNASICTVSYRAPANYRIVHLVILANLNWGLARFIWNLLFIWSYEIKIYMKK